MNNSLNLDLNILRIDINNVIIVSLLNKSIEKTYQRATMIDIIKSYIS